MTIKNKSKTISNIGTRAARLGIAGALGLFVYETSPGIIRELDSLEYTLYDLRQNGEYFDYAKELVKPVIFFPIEAFLATRSIQYFIHGIGLDGYHKNKEESK